MELTFLGTGTSFGVPVVGCDCAVCRSDDPRDRRTRHGAIVRWDDTTLLVDTPPELRLQLLDARVRKVDALWFTHTHADHVHGIDDVRAFTARAGQALPAFAGEEYVEALTDRFRYVFDESVPVAAGTTRPRIRLNGVRDLEPVDVLGRALLPLAVPHGSVRVYGFRAGDLGYVTDAKRLPEAVVAALQGVEVLVLNALWYGDPHPTHFNVEEAVEAARTVGAGRTLLTHITHRVRHADLLERLPDGVEPAHDGLTVDF